MRWQILVLNRNSIGILIDIFCLLTFSQIVQSEIVGDPFCGCWVQVLEVSGWNLLTEGVNEVAHNGRKHPIPEFCNWRKQFKITLVQEISIFYWLLKEFARIQMPPNKMWPALDMLSNYLQSFWVISMTWSWNMSGRSCRLVTAEGLREGTAPFSGNWLWHSSIFH